VNKHDELIARLDWRANKLAGPGWLMHNCVADLRDAQQLLQLYGDALEAIAAESQMKIPTGNGWTYTYSEMAAKALAGETIEGETLADALTKGIKEGWIEPPTTVEGG